MNKTHGRSNQHSLWNVLPSPTVENTSGVAHVKPLDVLRFMCAFGTEADEFKIDFSTTANLAEADTDNAEEELTDDDNNDQGDKAVFTMPESKACKEWSKEPQENLPEMPPGHTRAVLNWQVDWEDGFGANRTEQCRKSTSAHTLSTGTPSGKVNSIDGTFPIAIGLKKNPNWERVKKAFKRDMEDLFNGSKPVMPCHGGLKKVIPVFARRIACMCDEVERAECSSTLNCTSKSHRCFGKTMASDPPKFDAAGINEHTRKEAIGEVNVREHGWSHRFADTTTSGGRVPSCFCCRKKTVDLLRRGNPEDLVESDDAPCNACADWTLDDTTSQFLSFTPPTNCPALNSELPDCPVAPPPGREVGLERLELLELTFELMVQAGKHACFNCCERRRTGWNEDACKAHLRTVGHNTREQEELFEAARRDFANNVPVDCGPNSATLGTYSFPASWTMDLLLHRFIEMLMHLLFLGIAAANFKLANLHLDDARGTSDRAFKAMAHELLRDLTKCNLSWMLALPFNGSKKTNFTTGTWVSENWLAWVRLSKVLHAWVASTEEKEQQGANDITRMVASFTALVARVLSHSGSNKKSIGLVNPLVKEFLSSVRELDTRTRHKEMNTIAHARSSNDTDTGTTATPFGGESKDQWWLKSNHVSPLNLVRLIEELGPLINFWDGGGKGEKCMQQMKPHIPRGVRDGGFFFVRLMEKTCRLRALASIEESVVGNGDINKARQNNDGTSQARTSSSSGSSEGNVQTRDSSTVSSIVDAAVPTTIDVGDQSDAEAPEAEEQWRNPMEDAQMSKARMFCVHKRREQLINCLNDSSSIAAVVVENTHGKPEPCAAHKIPGSGKKLGWLRISFNDEEGVQKCGLHCAPLTLVEAKRPPKALRRLQKLACMAAVAIPVKCAMGDGHQDANKHCVLTSSWRERNSKGQCVFPNLDFERCLEKETVVEEEEQTSASPASNNQTV